MRLSLAVSVFLTGCAAASPPTPAPATEKPLSNASSAFQVTLSPLPHARDLLPDSPFGINLALSPDAPDLEARLDALLRAGIKWGRQDFSWKRIEKAGGEYDFGPYDRLLDALTRHGILIFGDLTGAPAFHDPRTPEGIEAYAAFARAAVRRYAGRVDLWQIWNEPNGGLWKESPEKYGALLERAGRAIHESNPNSKVLALNMAFTDTLWAQKVFKAVPWDAFDIVCFHPYRAMCAPEEPFDWWVLDQYVKADYWHRKDLTPDFPMVRMTFEEQTDQLVGLMKTFGRPKPLWVTEICWNTDLHPYGVSELRSADLLVRFYLTAIASGKIGKVFWWTLKDGGPLQFDKAQMVGLMRSGLEPKYSYFAYAVMARMLEGKRWVRNDAWGPEVFAAVFTDDQSEEDTVVLWSPKDYAYARVNNTPAGLAVTDLYGTRRVVTWDERRTKSNPIPVGQSPIYVTGPRGLKVSIRPNPDW
jgi:hypothetical protein